MRKSILLIALLFAIGTVLVACGEESEVTPVDGDNNNNEAEASEDNNNEENEENSDNNDAENNNDANEANEDDEEGGEQEESVSIGDTINFDGLDITLNDAYTDGGSDFEEPSNDHFVILDLTIENTTEEPADVSTMLQMSLQDDEGYTHNTTIYTEAQGSLDGEIGPGRDNRGEVVFDVNDSSVYEFIFEHPFTSGQAIWEIEID